MRNNIYITTRGKRDKPGTAIAMVSVIQAAIDAELRKAK
jgi:hypothetical protein